MNFSRHSIPWKKGAITLLLVILGFALLIVFIPSEIFPIPMDFRNNLWAPSMLLVHGQSPYHIQTLFEESNAIWMPMVVGLFFPMGFLPLRIASNLFLLLNLIALFTLAFLTTRRAQLELWWGVVALVGLSLFPATVSQFYQGQVSLLICLAFLILVYYCDILPAWLIGGLLAFSLTKPQLVVLFAPAFMLLYLRAYGWRKILGLVMATGFWIIGLSLPLFLAEPNWIPDFLANIASNSRWFYPTLYALMLNIPSLSNTAPWLAGLWLAFGIVLTVYLTFKLPRSEALLWSIALTLVFSPIVWSWDFVLVLPLFLTAIMRPQTKLSRGLLLGGYTLFTGLFILLRFGNNDDNLAVWVPLAMTAIVWINYFLRNLKVRERKFHLEDHRNFSQDL